MPVAADIIFLWTGTNASIPSGWTRETALDTLYPKGTAAGVNPGGTGGANTHSHTTQNHLHATAHVHTVPNSPAGSGNTNRDSGTTNPPTAHTHDTNPNTVNPTTSLANDNPSTDSVNHEPSNFVVIFIKSDGTPVGVPNNAVGITSQASAPIGWNLADGGAGRPDMRNRFLKGAAVGGDGGGTGGADTHTQTIASHTHTTPYAHAHPDVTSSQKTDANVAGAGSGAQVGTATSTHTHALTIGSASPVITGSTDSAASSNHEPPWTNEGFIQNNNGAADLPTNIIGMWLGTLASIPTDWVLCDGSGGTPDLRSQFIQGSNTLGDNGTTGGSLTHGHTATGHTHPVASHQHTVTGNGGAGENRTAGATGAATTAHTHPTWTDTGAASFTSGTGTPTVDDFTDTQPSFKTVAFIMYSPGGGAAEGRSSRYNQSFLLMGVPSKHRV